MSNNQQIFRKWLGAVAAGIISTIIGGVVLAPLIQEAKPPQTPLPNSPSSNSSPNTERWKFMGISTKTNEAVYVDNSSISKSGGTTRFIYKIGNDLIDANGDCDSNRWHSINKKTRQKYGWNSPLSQVTQSMINHVCKP